MSMKRGSMPIIPSPGSGVTTDSLKAPSSLTKLHPERATPHHINDGIYHIFTIISHDKLHLNRCVATLLQFSSLLCVWGTVFFIRSSCIGVTKRSKYGTEFLLLGRAWKYTTANRMKRRMAVLVT